MAISAGFIAKSKQQVPGASDKDLVGFLHLLCDTVAVWIVEFPCVLVQDIISGIFIQEIVQAVKGFLCIGKGTSTAEVCPDSICIHESISKLIGISKGDAGKA